MSKTRLTLIAIMLVALLIPQHALAIEISWQGIGNNIYAHLDKIATSVAIKFENLAKVLAPSLLTLLTGIFIYKSFTKGFDKSAFVNLVLKAVIVTALINFGSLKTAVFDPINSIINDIPTWFSDSSSDWSKAFSIVWNVGDANVNILSFGLSLILRIVTIVVMSIIYLKTMLALIITKAFFYLIMAVSPLLVLCGLFNSTTKYLMGAINLMISTILTILFINLVISLMAQLIIYQVEPWQDGDYVTVSAMLTLIVILMFAAELVNMAKSVVTNLTGSHAMQESGFMGRALGTAASMGMGFIGGALGAKALAAKIGGAGGLGQMAGKLGLKTGLSTAKMLGKKYGRVIAKGASSYQDFQNKRK